MKSKNMGTALRLRDGRSLPIEFIARLESGSHPNSTEAHGAERRREIEFAHLSDGTLVDLLCDRSGELIFAVLQNGMITVRHTVKDAGISFITPEVHSSLTRAVRFPTAIGANHAARQLLLEIEEVLERYFDCDPSHRNLLAHLSVRRGPAYLGRGAVLLRKNNAITDHECDLSPLDPGRRRFDASSICNQRGISPHRADR